jgi:hypothetical protein
MVLETKICVSSVYHDNDCACVCCAGIEHSTLELNTFQYGHKKLKVMQN